MRPSSRTCAGWTVVTITVDEARAVFERRIAAWLTEDVDAYVACWHDDMRIEMPTGVIEGAARYRNLVVGSFAWAAPVSFDVHHLAVDGPNDVVFALLCMYSAIAVMEEIPGEFSAFRTLPEAVEWLEKESD